MSRPQQVFLNPPGPAARGDGRRSPVRRIQRRPYTEKGSEFFDDILVYHPAPCKSIPAVLSGAGKFAAEKNLLFFLKKTRYKVDEVCYRTNSNNSY